MASGTARAPKRPARHARHASEPVTIATWIRRISPAGWTALGACLVALALALHTLQGPVADYDEGVYWQSLRAMASGHPLFSAVFSSQPPLFLLSVYPFYMFFGQGLSAARMALVVFSVAGIAGVYVTGRALGHRNIGAVAAVVLALDPLYQHGAHTLQAEMPSVALQIWAVAFSVLAMRTTGRWRGWLAMGAGVLLGCALLIKLFAVVALVPMVLYLGVPLIRRWHGDTEILRRPSWPEVQAGLRQIAPTFGWFVAGLAGAAFLILLPFAGRLGALYDQVVRFHLVAAQTDHSSLAHNFGIILTTLAGTPLSYLSIFALFFIVWRRVWTSAPLLLWAMAAIILLLRQQPLLG
ncbi:MAG: ArnT family glycosyltransferase, partial [Nitrososphaerota archaeon]